MARTLDDKRLLNVIRKTSKGFFEEDLKTLVMLIIEGTTSYKDILNKLLTLLTPEEIKKVFCETMWIEYCNK